MATNIVAVYRKWYSKELMLPDVFGILINPLYKIRKDLSDNIEEFSKGVKGNLLDFGCGSMPYKKYFNVKSYVGLDLEKSGFENEYKRADVFYDGKNIPFKDGYFDSVFCSEVLEHVFNPNEVVVEINRVLKKRGKLLITVPFVWDEHEVPYDYARYSSYGLRYLIEINGFKLLKSKKLGNYVDTLSQMWCVYLYKHLYTKNFVLNAIVQFLVISPFMLLGLCLGKILPVNKDFYNNNIMLFEKI